MKVRFHKGGLAKSMATVFEPLNYKDLLEHIKALCDNIDPETIVCEELHQIKCRGSVAASRYHEKMIELEKELMHPRMQRNPTAILRLAKELVECKNSALCHEKTIKELREKRNKLKKNIKGLEAKISEMELDSKE